MLTVKSANEIFKPSEVDYFIKIHAETAYVNGATDQELDYLDQTANLGFEDAYKTGKCNVQAAILPDIEEECQILYIWGWTKGRKQRDFELGLEEPDTA